MRSTIAPSPGAVKPTLNHLAKTSELQELVIQSPSHNGEMPIPPKQFLALGSLPKLSTLRLGDSFLPDINFTEADARTMFSGLGVLENLAIGLHASNDSPVQPKHILQAISRCCPRLKSLELEGGIHLSWLIGPDASRFENVTELTFDKFCTNLSSSEAARIIDNALPALEMLYCSLADYWFTTSNPSLTEEICIAYTKLQHQVRSNGLRPRFEKVH